MNNTKWLDRLPAPVRHNVIMLFGYFSTVVVSIQTGEPFNLKVFLWGVATIEMTQVGLFLAPFNSQYGVGKKK